MFLPFKMIRSLVAVFIAVICFVCVSGQNGNSDRQVFYKPSFIAIISNSTKTGVILDYSSSLILVLNGNQTFIITVNTSEQVGYYLEIEADALNSTWFNFGEYFKELSPLQSLLENGQEKGEEFELENLEEPVREVLKEALTTLGGYSPIPVEVSLLTKFIEQLNTTLSLMYSKTGSFRLAIGVDRFREINMALAGLLSYSEGTLSTDDVDLPASQMFTTSSGAEVVQKVLYRIGARYDLTKIFGELITKPEKVQSLMLNASGGARDGLDGQITILADYVGIFTGRNGIDQLIDSVVLYNLRPALSLSSFVNRMLALLENQDRNFHNAPYFSTYVSILRGIVSNNYTVTNNNTITNDNNYNNISLSDIVTLLPTEARKSKNPLFTLMKLFSNLYPNSTIPHFFGSTIEQFNPSLDSGSTTENSNSEVFYKSSLVAIINIPDRTALMLDYESRLIVVLNENRSSAIVVDLPEQVKYYLKNNDEAYTGNSKWSNFTGYFKELLSLEDFLETSQENGEKSTLDTLEEPVLGDLEEVFHSLGGSLPIPEQLLLHTKLIKKLRKPLPVLYKRRGSFSIASGVDAFAKVNVAIAGMLTVVQE